MDYDIEFWALVHTKGTLVFLMGITAMEDFCNGLMKAGMEPDMPAAVLSKGTTAGQKRVVATVGTLKAAAAQRAAQRKNIEKREKIQRRKERLNRIQHAKPFKSGLKWGLKQGNKVIVPPVYRNLQTPVGNYCAFEGNPRQWGVIMLDGKVVVEARYINVEIKENGTARLTIIPGKTKTVKLQ